MASTDFFIENLQHANELNRENYMYPPAKCENEIQVMEKLWHPTRNGSLTLLDVSSGSNQKVWWKCKKGHEWQAKVYSVRSGTSCPYCAGKKPANGETDLATTHPQLIKMWSPRNRLSPSEVTAGSQKRILLLCEQGHEWETDVVSVAVLGRGCPYCAGKRAIPGETDFVTVRPDLLSQWDFEKNTVDPVKITVASHEKVWWKCSLGHSWSAMVFSRTREKASECPYCTGRRVLPGFNDVATLKPQLARQWYQPLNGDLTPVNVTLGSNKKVWWQCSEGHVWQAYIYARTRSNATGCPVCAGVVKQNNTAARLHG